MRGEKSRQQAQAEYRCRHKIERLGEQATLWRGKFNEVRHENNALRRANRALTAEVEELRAALDQVASLGCDLAPHATCGEDEKCQACVANSARR